jgi:hypothetical protein
MLSFSFKKWTLVIVLALVSTATPLAGAEKGKGGFSEEKLRAWLGRKVDVVYRACDPAGCVPVRRATLKEVSEEAITVIVNDSPFYIPKHMIEGVTLSE